MCKDRCVLFTPVYAESAAMSEQLIPFGPRVSQLAAQHPDKPAMIYIPLAGEARRVTWREFDSNSNRCARLLEQHGVNDRSMVVIGLPDNPEHLFVAYGAWKLGALVLPLRHDVPARERDQILDLARPAIVVADWQNVPYPLLRSEALAALLPQYSDLPVADRVAHPGKSIGSGGSTGRPKIIVDPNPWALIPGENVFGRAGAGFAPGQVQIVAGPLYHNAPFGWAHSGLFNDHTLLLLERLNPARIVDLIEEYGVNFAPMSPTMMQRIARLPNIGERDFSSLAGLYHVGAPCPPWVKRAWIALLGGERVFEGYGSTEMIGSSRIRGDEWLEHPGSVGKPTNCEVRILDENGRDLPPGEVGEIFMRRLERSKRTYEYIGAPPLRMTQDGFSTVGDMGWIDERGYLYLADRRVDLIITGGANVYPAEVEAVISEHEAVLDVAVIGLPDEDWGKRVHAVIQLRATGSEALAGELDAFCRERLMPYKVPKSYEFVNEFPREPSGKIRRRQMVEERETGWSPAMIRPGR